MEAHVGFLYSEMVELSRALQSASQPAKETPVSQPTARMLFPGFPGNRAEALSLNSRLIRPIRADQPGIDATVGSSTPRSPNQISEGRVWKNAPSKAPKK